MGHANGGRGTRISLERPRANGRSVRRYAATRIPALPAAGGEAGVCPAGVARVATGVGGARPAPSQFPVILRRAAHLADRHLDADRRPVVAGLSHDRFGAAVGRGRLRQPDSGLHHGAGRRHRSRPSQPPARGHRHADLLDDSGGDSGRAHASHGFRCGTSSCWRRCWAW